jgi:hypothetical protein
MHSMHSFLVLLSQDSSLKLPELGVQKERVADVSLRHPFGLEAVIFNI